MDIPVARPVPSTNRTVGAQPYEFSMVLGGPLYQLLRRAHLSGDALELLRRRLVVILLFVWVPLLALTAWRGEAWGHTVAVPFLTDIEVHIRLLLALPLLIATELVVHQMTRGVLREFVRRGLVADSSRARLEAAISSAVRLRDSVLAEVILISAVYLVGVFYVWPRFIAISDVSTWYAVPQGGRRLSPAGWWFVFVSLPIFQFILLRWYFRLFIWTRLLRQVARCELKLVATHPDRVGGLGFLGLVPIALAPFLAAHGLALAGLISEQIFFHGAKLIDFELELVAVLVFLLILVAGSLLFFVPRLARLKRAGLHEYGALAQCYVREFDEKWIRGRVPSGEPLIGSSDIQSLADLGNSFGIIESIRLVPVTGKTLLKLAAITLLPVAPLLLTMVPVEELLKGLLRVIA